MKFVKLVTLFFQRNFVFRANLLIKWLTILIRFLFTIMFWLAAIQNAGSDFAYSGESVIIYFFVIMILGLYVETDVADRVSGTIYNGNLTVDLLKPISYHKIHFSKDMSEKVLLLVILLIITGVFFFMPGYSPVFAVSVLLAMIINFELNYIIGVTGFWTYTVWGIALINGALMDVFGGRLFPISIAGDVFKTACAYLPYQYIYYIPVQVLEGRVPMYVLVNQLGYACVLYLISSVVYKRGLKRFEAVGV